MSETAEVQANAEVVSSPELTHAIAKATEEIQRDMERPTHQAAVPAGEVGFLSALWKAAEPHVKNVWGVQWKELKTQGMASLSLIPFLGHGAELAKAVGAAEKATVATAANADEMVLDAVRILNQKQRDIFIKAMKDGASQIEALKYAKQGALTRNFLEKAGHSIKEGMRHEAIQSIIGFLDPFPDVPHQVHNATLLISLIGFLPIPGAQVAFGANLLPAAWQYLHNKYEMAKEGLGMAQDVGVVIGRELGTMLGNAKKPEVAHAAAAFHHE